MAIKADIRVTPKTRYALPISDDLASEWIQDMSAPVGPIVPGFRYWELDESRKMDRDENITGYQQRAWEFYWSSRIGLELRRPALGLGTGGIPSPFMLTTDKYCGESPCEARYGINAYPMMRLDADTPPYPFFDGKIGGVVSNHLFEHLHNQEAALQEWFRITMYGGYICILQPHVPRSMRGQIDPTHVTEWTADDFYHWFMGLALPPFEIMEHNTLDNEFSFETVLKKISKDGAA
jgi:SAM-dependent methyltransferase